MVLLKVSPNAVWVDAGQKTTTRASDTQTHKLTRHYWLADWHTHRHTERKKENIPSEKQRKPLAHHATPLDALVKMECTAARGRDLVLAMSYDHAHWRRSKSAGGKLGSPAPLFRDCKRQ